MLSNSHHNDSHVSKFSLSLTRALEQQLTAELKGLTTRSLNQGALDALDEAPGIYQLFLDHEPVYVGKADKSLRLRLQKHHRKLSGRVSDSEAPLVDRTTFKCVYMLEDLDALGPEKMLIKKFRPEGQARWNVNGFGNNDPGRNRDRSMVKVGHFDRSYPIDLNASVVLDVVPKAPLSNLAQFMQELKSSLPYLFRFPAKGPDFKELCGVPIEVVHYSGATDSALGWFETVASHLPAGWLITALPGYVICYKEMDSNVYGSRLGSWAGGAPNPTFNKHQPTFAYNRGSEIEEESIADERLDTATEGDSITS